MRRLACLLLGHRWRVLRTNCRRFVAEGHRNPMAGKDADCERCGKRWRDSGIDSESLAEAIAKVRQRFDEIARAGLCDGDRPVSCDAGAPRRR